MSSNNKCHKCKKKFEYPSDLKRHLERKNPCDKKVENIPKLFKCPKCDTTFTIKGNLDRHMIKFCPLKSITTKQDTTVSDKFGECSYPSGMKSIPESEIKKSTLLSPNIDVYNFCGETNPSGVESKTETNFKYINDDKIIICKYCSKEFTRKDSLKKHLDSRCKEKIKTEREEYNKQQQSKMDELMKRIELLENDRRERSEDMNVVNVSANNNNIINSNNTVNIQLLAFGKENRSKLTQYEILKIMNKGFYSVPALLKAIHFDKDTPENHNIYAGSHKQNVVDIYNGEKWVKANRKETIHNLFDDGRNFLLNKVEEFNDILLSDVAKKMVNKFEYFDNDIDDYPIKKRDILNEISLLLYNERDIIEKTRKIIKKD